MENLLQPHTGLMVWTVVTFLGLVAVLGAFVWKPILSGLQAREGKIKSDLERAEKAQKDAEALRLQFESQLSEAQKTIQQMMAQARSDAERSRIQMLESSKQEAERLLEKGRKDLAGETERLKLELQNEVAVLSVSIAEKILERSIDSHIQTQVLKESLKTLEGVRR